MADEVDDNPVNSVLIFSVAGRQTKNHFRRQVPSQSNL